jgi:hypothetical protein
MAGLPSTAGMFGDRRHRRFVHMTGHWLSLFDHLIGARQEGLRDREADRLRGREIDDQLVGSDW